VTYVYLDALTEPQGVETKAQEAFRQYQAMQPDGVIAVGDDAQSAFVVPYLREKVKTPVMFCGIPSPEKFDYPAANVSGISLHELLMIPSCSPNKWCRRSPLWAFVWR
jgi:hypothetical protein